MRTGRDKPLHLSICVATYKRPQGLTRLLRSIAAAAGVGEHFDVELLVVDNDSEGSARSACESLARELELAIRYAVEPCRGIAIARNHSVRLARPESRFLVFVDDDEVVDPAWLFALTEAQAEFGADVVTGPVHPRYPSDPPDWLVRGRFLEYTGHDTGEQLEHAYTNNTLVNADVLRSFSPPFDEGMALTGGEDTHLFRRISHAGHRIVWTNDAIAHESIPAERMTIRWVLRRAYSYGVRTLAIEDATTPRWRSAPHFLAAACYRILKGALLLPCTCFLGRHHSVLYMRHVCFGAGVVVGALGLRFDEYARTDGD